MNLNLRRVKTANWNYILFLLVFYVFIFRNAFTEWISALNYFDELFAVAALPLFFGRLFVKNFRCERKKNRYSPWIILFIAVGLAGSVAYRYQPFVKAVVPDVLLNLKFWMAIYVSGVLFGQIDLNKYGRKIGNHVKLVVWIYVVLVVIDNVTGGIFHANIRYGFRSTQLFYGIHTLFAAMCGFLLVLLTVVKRHVKHFELYMMLLLMLMASTMRSKAFGAVLFYVVLYFMVMLKKRKIELKMVAVLGILCLIVAWPQIQFYFFSSISYGAARNVLLLRSFEVANDHFPFGAGLGTYASHYSGVYYSPLYERYGLSTVYGLTPYNQAYVSDSFWPMLLGQNGYIGTIFFVVGLFMLYLQIQKLAAVDKEYYLGMFYALVYLGVSSMAESAFVNPLAIPFAIVIGMILNRKNSIYGGKCNDKKTIASCGSKNKNLC